MQHSAVSQMLLVHSTHLDSSLSRRVPQGFSSVWQEANRSSSTITPVYEMCCQPQARHSNSATQGAFTTKFAPGLSGVVVLSPPLHLLLEIEVSEVLHIPLALFISTKIPWPPGGEGTTVLYLLSLAATA